MKKHYKVTFEHSEGAFGKIFCTNIAIAESAEAVEAHYSEYPWVSVTESPDWEVESYRMKGCPFITVD